MTNNKNYNNNNGLNQNLLCVPLIKIYSYLVMWGLFTFFCGGLTDICFSLVGFPVTIYANADTQKMQILKENTGRSGVYM